MIFVILKFRYNICCNSNLKRNLYPIFFFICFFLKSCASHPVINPHLPEPGITKRGYAISVENVKSAQERFATMDEKRDGLTVIGRWHEAGNRGFMVCEAEDVVALGKFANQWSDLCDIDIVPLMTDEEVGQVLAG